MRDNWTGDIIQLPVINGQIDLSSLGRNPRVVCIEREDTLYDDAPIKMRQFREDPN